MITQFKEVREFLKTNDGTGAVLFQEKLRLTTRIFLFCLSYDKYHISIFLGKDFFLIRKIL